MKSIFFMMLFCVLLAPNISRAGEWRFFASHGPNGNTIFLSEDSSTTKGCEGKLEASEQKLALGKWVYIRELCYEVDKSGMVKLTDPEKIRFFNSFTMSASGFSRIPTKKEREEAEQARIAEQNYRAMQEFTRQYNENQRQMQQQRRGPIICNHLGDISICD